MNTSNYTNLAGLRSTRPEFSELELIERDSGTMDNLLYDLLATISPYGKEEPIAKIIEDYVAKVSPNASVDIDTKGNLIIKTTRNPKAMFSSHMDVVRNQASGNKTHNDLYITKDGYVYAGISKTQNEFTSLEDNETYSSGAIKSKAIAEGFDFDHYTIMPKGKGGKTVSVWGTNDMFHEPWTLCGDSEYITNEITVSSPNVLGADDKLGCYIMCKLIDAGIGGLFVFHVGEECGGIGSDHIATSNKDLVKGVKCCVAFDRMGYTDIITNQSGGKCCSNEFANELSRQMNLHLPPKVRMSASTRGTFTDSANYTDIIPECTNVAVGYKNQHGTSEYFDHEWLEKHLIPTLITVNWSKLPVKRDPNEVTSLWGNHMGYGSYGHYGSRWGHYDSWGEDAEYMDKGNSPYTVTELFEPEKKKPKSQTSIHQSALAKMNNELERIEPFSPFVGFEPGEDRTTRVGRVLATFLKEEMSDKEKAELVVEAFDENQWDI